MADKLSESSWTSFTKGALKKHPKLKLEDAALVKALGALDRSDDSKPEEKLKALEAVIEQIKKQVVANARRKKEFGDELFDDAKDKLYELLEAAEAQQKATQKAAVKVQPAEDEEEESPALLTTKMIPLLREVRKGEL